MSWRTILRPFLALLAASGLLVSCDDLGSGTDNTPTAKYHYPNPCAGGRAVWWMDRENRIDKEPLVKESVTPGSGETRDMHRYTCHLNFGKDRFSKIGEYFEEILGKDYDYDAVNSTLGYADWEDNNTHEFPYRTYFVIHADPYDTGSGIMYDTLYSISVTGDQEGGNYVLTIEYLYTHFTRD